MRAQSINALLLLPRWAKRSIMMAIDATLCAVSVVVAFYLRLGEWPAPSMPLLLATLTAPALAVPMLSAFSLYRTIFRHVGLSVLAAASRAVLLYGLVYAAIFTLWSLPGVPRTVGLIAPGLFLLFALAVRTLLARLVTGSPDEQAGGQAGRMLIYGAGSAGRQIAAALLRAREVEIVGFIDDDPTLHGNLLEGLRIFPPTDIGKVIESLDVRDVLLALPSASRQRRQEILTMIRGHDVSVRMMPGVPELASGKIVATDLREVDIVDLLGRPAVAPDRELLSRDITDRTVLVSGAGGSIGSELCRQIAAIGPARLILVESSEFGLYSIHSELIRSQPHLSAAIEPVLASVRDKEQMAAVFSRWRPDTVYHAAAYKHVPLVEHNPVEGVLNNVEGTRVIAEVAAAHDVSNFVLISTDKAVRPTNVMGASKRVAELVLQAMAASHYSTRFSMVRFGNVLGSSGSVVPLFREQIARGGPITLTDPRITRYFMTIPEAAELVIQAGAMAKGGEVFLLDMGAPIKIIDLATTMIELSGLKLKNEENPDGDIEIRITGLRPGEKLYEELLIGGEAEPTSHPRIMKANEHFFSEPELGAKLETLLAALKSRDAAVIRSALSAVVVDYAPGSEALRMQSQQQLNGARATAH